MTRFYYILIYYILIINLANCGTDVAVGEKLKSIKNNLVSEHNIQSTPDNLISSSNIVEEQSQYENKIDAVTDVPRVIVRIYAGAVAILPCKLSVTRLQTIMWFYSETNFPLRPLQDDETIISEYNLTIYNVQPEHAGVYKCVIDGQLKYGLVSLEVVDDEQYNVVKPLTSRGPYPMKAVQLSSSLIMFSAWSDWSECSRCGMVGRRRRYGVCYVTLTDEFPSRTNKSNTINIDEETSKLFRAFPGGIPCRSKLMPPSIRYITSVQKRPNEIMLRLCKVKCNEAIVRIRSKSSDTVETVNNSAGIYSLYQKTPKQPPLPARHIIYVEPGDKVIIRCSGTVLRDMPYSWRADNQYISPRRLFIGSDGRVHLNARDHIVFRHALYSDAHVYSCWQNNILAGVVKLQVERSAKTTYRQRLRLCTLIVMLIVILRLTLALVHYRRRYLGIL